MTGFAVIIGFLEWSVCCLLFIAQCAFVCFILSCIGDYIIIPRLIPCCPVVTVP